MTTRGNHHEPDTVPDRLGTRLRSLHPAVATLFAAALGYVVLVATALALGFLVTHFVVDGALGRGDSDIVRWFADRRTSFWNDTSVVGSHLAGTVTVLASVGLVLALLAWKRKWPQFGLLAISLALEGGVYAAATFAIHRNRPAVPRLERLIVSDSFPSGHTAAAVALYGSLVLVVWSLTTRRRWRSLALVLAVVVPIAVATSRVYRGMHNPTDVISGALLGAGCIVAAYLAVRTGLVVAHERRAAEPDRWETRELQVPEVVR
jgi:membrane-associated phospholipid phosphatase